MNNSEGDSLIFAKKDKIKIHHFVLREINIQAILFRKIYEMWLFTTFIVFAGFEAGFYYFALNYFANSRQSI